MMLTIRNYAIDTTDNLIYAIVAEAANISKDVWLAISPANGNLEDFWTFKRFDGGSAAYQKNTRTILEIRANKIYIMDRYASRIYIYDMFGEPFLSYDIPNMSEDMDEEYVNQSFYIHGYDDNRYQIYYSSVNEHNDGQLVLFHNDEYNTGVWETVYTFELGEYPIIIKANEDMMLVVTNRNKIYVSPRVLDGFNDFTDATDVTNSLTDSINPYAIFLNTKLKQVVMLYLNGKVKTFKYLKDGSTVTFQSLDELNVPGVAIMQTMGVPADSATFGNNLSLGVINIDQPQHPKYHSVNIASNGKISIGVTSDKFEVNPKKEIILPKFTMYFQEQTLYLDEYGALHVSKDIGKTWRELKVNFPANT